MILKTSLNALALAATLALASGGASADIIGAGIQDSEMAEGATELMLVVWSESAKLSFAQDLGLSIDAVKANANTAGWMQSFTMDPLYTSSALASATDVKWFVAGYDTYTATGSLEPGDLQLVSTASAPLTAAQPGLTGDQMTSGLSGWIEFSGQTENIIPNGATLFSTHKTADNGISLVNDTSAAYVLADANAKDNLSGFAGFSMANAAGASSSLYHFTSADLFDGGLPATLTTYLASASFDGNTLTISAVPEPGTYAMLAAGLMAVGFVVRRRQPR